MPNDRGVVLLEVLVALTILAVAGLSLAAAISEQTRSLADLHGREGELGRAEVALTRLTLSDRKGLDIRLGRRRVGGFVTDIQRPRPTLYRIAVADTSTPDAALLVTVVHRPEVP